MDMGSIDELYRRYGASVLRRARTILGDEQAARDATQEVFMQALRAGESFRGDASPTTWLYRVTTNYCLNVLRNRARRRSLLARWLRRDAPQPISAEERMSVSAALLQIPERLRHIGVYYYVDEMSQEEIAELLGLPRRTVSHRLAQFRAAARLQLDDESVGSRKIAPQESEP